MIIYGDGSTHDDPFTAPPLNVQAVIYVDPGRQAGTLCIRGWDYYLLEGEGWIGVNGSVDLIDHVLHKRPQVVLKGRMLPREEWVGLNKLISKAMQDFPNKSAFVRGFEEPNPGPDGVTDVNSS